MKKQRRKILISVLCIGFLFPMSTSIFADETNMDNTNIQTYNTEVASVYNNEFGYTISSDKVTITSYTGSGGDVVVPQKIEGYDVVEIDSHSFWEKTTITSVQLPNTVKRIWDSAFTGCTNLKTINLPEGLESLGDGAFARCKNLKKINMPTGIKGIFNYTFWGCESLTEVVIPEGVTSLDGSAFSDCTSLESIHLPESLTTMEIGMNTNFFENTALKEIVIPKNVMEFMYYEGGTIFDGCQFLEKIYILNPEFNTDAIENWGGTSETKLFQLGKNLFDVQFKVRSGDENLGSVDPDSLYIPVNETLISKVPQVMTRSEAKFIGWYKNEVKVESLENEIIQSEVTYEARFILDRDNNNVDDRTQSYNVQYVMNSNDSEKASLSHTNYSILYGEKVGDRIADVQIKYNKEIAPDLMLEGWYKNGVKVENIQDEVIVDDVVYTAKMKGDISLFRSYFVINERDGQFSDGTQKQKVLTHIGETVKTPELKLADNKELVGWYMMDHPNTILTEEDMHEDGRMYIAKIREKAINDDQNSIDTIQPVNPDIDIKDPIPDISTPNINTSINKPITENETKEPVKTTSHTDLKQKADKKVSTYAAENQKGKINTDLPVINTYENISDDAIAKNNTLQTSRGGEIGSESGWDMSYWWGVLSTLFVIGVFQTVRKKHKTR